MIQGKNRVTELGELCVEIGKRLIDSPIENLGHEELVQAKKAGKLIIDHFKLKVQHDDETYQVYVKYGDYGKKDLSLSEVSIILSEDLKGKK